MQGTSREEQMEAGRVDETYSRVFIAHKCTDAMEPGLESHVCMIPKMVPGYLFKAVAGSNPFHRERSTISRQKCACKEEEDKFTSLLHFDFCSLTCGGDLSLGIYGAFEEYSPAPLS